jgi:hypothetical protein
MKKYLKPVIIGMIGGFLPTLFGYTIITWQWWILMPIFSFFVWVAYCIVVFTFNLDKK